MVKKLRKINIIISVRTVVELVQNKGYYVDQFTRLVGPFDKALQRVCNNNTFCELYEIVALTNVLRCEIQSVYPYIDYRAELKVMNTIYKPMLQSLSIKRVLIFWTNTKDERLVRSRPGFSGTWSPNHFVPLISANSLNRINTIDEVIVTPEV